MTNQELIRKIFKDGHIYNVHAVAQKSGLRNLKLHEFIKGTTKLTDAEALSVLRLLRKCNNATKIV